MKIGYFADGPWSHKAIELITNTPGFEIAFIVPRYETRDPILQAWADKLHVPFLPHDNVNSEEFLSCIRKYEADLFVSMSFNQILKNEIITLPRLGFINCHAGALPFYRGRNPLNWALINGEKQFGITVHYVDEGIDTGDIVEQRLFPIAVTDNYATLLNKAIRECANILHSAISKINTGKFTRLKQGDIHPVGTYFGIRTFGDELIDFGWSSERVHNFIRGICSPGPNARCFIGEQEYSVISSELIPNAPSYIATTGEVVGRNENGVVVKVGDSTILLTEMTKVDKDVESERFVPSFRIGTRFRVGGKHEL